MSGPGPTDGFRETRLEWWLRRGWSLVCGGLITWAVLATAWQRGELLDFYPLNGDFQNFNPIRRWLAGEAPGRDFNIYLGLGPTGMMTVVTAALGGDYRASLMAVAGLCVVFQAASWGVAARCLGSSRTAAWSLAAIAVLFTAAPHKLWLPRHLRDVLVTLSEHLIQPGNSVLGLRAAAPVLVAMGLWFTARWWRPGTAWTSRALVLGCWGGLILPWSNDYGLATAFALGVTSAWSAYPETTWRRWCLALSVQALAMALTAGLVVAVLTKGAPVEWFRAGFLGVAQDQFWYFDGPKVLSWKDLPYFPALLCGALCLLWWLIQTRPALTPASTAIDSASASSTGDDVVLRQQVALFLLLSPFVAALISITGGHIDSRYTFPLTRVLYLFVPAASLQILAVIGRRCLPTALPRRPDWLRLETVLCLALAIQTTMLARRYARELTRLPQPAAPWQFDVPELGGRLSSRFGPVVDLARDVRDRVNHDAVPANCRILATYTSLIDIIAEASTPTRADYIIHALGDRERDRYLTAFRNARPEYVVTTRDDWDEWECWLRRHNWDFYRELITHYVETDRTYYARLWSPLPRPRTPLEIAVPIRQETLSPSAVLLEFRLPETVPADRGPILCEVEVDYVTAATAPLLSNGVFRQYLEANEIDRPFRLICLSNWGLPLGRQTRKFSIELDPGRAQMVLFDLAPEWVSRLDVTRARCTALFPVRDIDDPPQRHFRVAHWTAGPWHSGVARPEAKFHDAPAAAARVIVSDITDLRHLAVGDTLRFAVSGVRTVTAIEGPRVTVDGPALLPEDSARPVEVVHPVWRPHRSTNRDLQLRQLTTPDWRNGICIEGGRAGCYLNDRHQALSLGPGDRLHFAGSGERVVERVEGRMVWVEGPALDPVLDGPPETVRWITAPDAGPRWRDWTRPLVRPDNE